jgi:hypothetical protein
MCRAESLAIESQLSQFQLFNHTFRRASRRFFLVWVLTPLNGPSPQLTANTPGRVGYLYVSFLARLQSLICLRCRVVSNRVAIVAIPTIQSYLPESFQTLLLGVGLPLNGPSPQLTANTPGRVGYLYVSFLARLQSLI